ncbi:MAG: amidase, partial [Gemmatimonadota bacterium]|nr:amidase [Gemmatimonadota bacterium]
MDRRNFVRIGAVAGFLGIRGNPLGAETLDPGVEASLRRDRFVISPFELEEATIADLQAGMSSGRMTSRSITQQYMARIDELDRKGPTLRHVLEINP